MAVDLATALRIENAAASGQLSKQGGDQHAAEDTGLNAHEKLLMNERTPIYKQG
jgi:hypothetical protein